MYKNAGALTSLYVAFSRDQREKVYVQHMLLRDENRQQLWHLLDVEGAHLYVCGDGGKMARDVLAAVEKIVMTEGGRDEAAAREYVKRLRQKGRYSEDVWS
jgi:sulfite reductase alpha subunit-like flavoprotein